MKQTRDEVGSFLDPLLTIPEVAKILRCSERTILRFVQSGRLRAVQTGRRYTFTRHDVAEFVRQSLTTTRARNPKR
ncbi:MAG: helix-turn-helix domain-containing protein [Pyrinomonadaceae bacterium]